jgi:phage tail sheath gpL-like
MSTFPGLAAGTGSGAVNTGFGAATEVLKRKQIIVATYDPAKTLVVDETPVLVISPEDTGDKFGFGFMAHRLHRANDLGAQGVETWIQPQAEAGGAVVSDGEIDWAGTAGVVKGILAVYIAAEKYPVTITTAMTLEEVSDAVVALVNSVSAAPVIAAKTAVTFETTFTAKSKGPWGDDISISISLEPGDETPVGIAFAITAMTNGAGIPSMSDALDALGTGDNANEAHFTALIHGYGQDSTTLDAISLYVGEGNDFTGLYSKTVARPFYSSTGDVAAGSSGLSDMIVISDTRLEDRSDGFIGVPDSKSHPSEISAQGIGIAERGFNKRATASVVGKTLIGVDPGAKDQRWTSDYDDRDTAVRSGISPTLVVSGSVKMQNFVTFYRPANVSVGSNGYREIRNVSVTQNILNSQKIFFSRPKWEDFDIVSNVQKVTNPEAKKRARDRQSVLDDVILLLTAWEGLAWIYSAQFSIDKIKAEPSRVVIRGTGDGFDVNIPVLYSGIGNVKDVQTEFDISFAVLNQ